MRPAVSIACFSFAVAMSACSGNHPRDIGGGKFPRSEFEEPTGDVSTTSAVRRIGADAPSTAPSAGVKPRLLARARTRAIATTKTHVYFGSAEDDTLLAIAKAGGEPVRVARRAPLPGALAIDGDSVVWIPSPGDVVLRAPLDRSSPPTTLRDRGIFTDVEAGGGDVFVTEASSGGGALMRITGTTAAKLASFDAVPRAIAADGDEVFVVTAPRLVRAPRQRGEAQVLAVGTGLGSVATDAKYVYFTAKDADSRSLFRVSRTGDRGTTRLATGVRDTPIALRHGEVYFVDEARGALRAVPASGGAGRTISEDPLFAQVFAVAADDEGVYVATGDGEDAVVLMIALDR